MLRKLYVSGYRVFQDFHADLRPLNVVIGANSTGKSTLLDFLQFISEAMVFDLLSAVRQRGGPALLGNAFSPDELLSWDLLLEFTATYSPHLTGSAKAAVAARYKASLNLRYLMPEELVQSEVLLWSEPAFFGEERPVLKRKGRRAVVFDDERGDFVQLDLALAKTRVPTRPDQPSLFDLDDHEKVEEDATETEKAPHSPGTDRPLENLLLSELRTPWVAYPLALLSTHLSWLVVYPGFDVRPSSRMRNEPCVIQRNVCLLPDGSNLSGVLHEILTRREYQKSRESLLDYIRSAYPEFADLTVETAEAATGRVGLRWHEQGLPRGLFASELSDGVLRFLCLATALNNPNPPPLIGIDEPEVGLHPKLLPIVADMIKDAAERTQVVVTTHSPDFLDHFGLDDVAVMLRQENRILWHRPSSRKELAHLLQSVEGESLGDLHRSGELETIP